MIRSTIGAAADVSIFDGRAGQENRKRKYGVRFEDVCGRGNRPSATDGVPPTIDV
jgi:hypothetical protein